ncbi:MAG: hypothetical protein IJ928_03005 [Prevotella sp.]|nr:hypothetical protein [Prevotella sp.]
MNKKRTVAYHGAKLRKKGERQKFSARFFMKIHPCQFFVDTVSLKKIGVIAIYSLPLQPEIGCYERKKD